MYTYRAGQALVTSAELPTTSHFVGASPDLLALGLPLVLKPALIAELLLDGGASGRPQARAGTVPSGLSRCAHRWSSANSPGCWPSARMARPSADSGAPTAA